jgi:hypothetical protein
MIHGKSVTLDDIKVLSGGKSGINATFLEVRAQSYLAFNTWLPYRIYLNSAAAIIVCLIILGCNSWMGLEKSPNCVLMLR